jgi:anti-anti-sigma factor
LLADGYNEGEIARVVIVEAVVMAQPGLSLFDDEGHTTVKIEGSARVEMAVLLKQELTRAQIAHEVAIDWGEAEHVDACVLQILLAFGKLLAERGSSLIVERDNPKVRQYLELSGLSEYFPVRDRSPQGHPSQNHPPQSPPAEAANA